MGWGPAEYLLTDLFRALTGEEHPARPKRASSTKTAGLVARLKAQSERLSGKT